MTPSVPASPRKQPIKGVLDADHTPDQRPFCGLLVKTVANGE